MCGRLKAHPSLFIQIFLLCPFLFVLSLQNQSEFFTSIKNVQCFVVVLPLLGYLNLRQWLSKRSHLLTSVTPRNHQQVCGVVVLRCSLCVVSTFNVKWINIWKAADVTLAFVTSSPDRWPSGNINPDSDCASSDLAPCKYGFGEVYDGQV